mgnify:CR=1 FL=1
MTGCRPCAGAAPWRGVAHARRGGVGDDLRTPAQERGWSTNFAQFTQIVATPRIGEPETRGSTASLDFTVRVVMSDNSGQATTTNIPYTALYDRAGSTWALREFQQRP